MAVKTEQKREIEIEREAGLREKFEQRGLLLTTSPHHLPHNPREGTLQSKQSKTGRLHSLKPGSCKRRRQKEILTSST